MADTHHIKDCPGCGKILPLSMFAPKKGGRMGVTVVCRTCKNRRTYVARALDPGYLARSAAEMRARRAEHGRPDRDIERERWTTLRNTGKTALPFDEWTAEKQAKAAEAEAERAKMAAEKARRAEAARAKREADRARKPWLAAGLTDAERYRLRYAHDREFNLQERIRRHFKKLGLGGMSASRMRRKLGYGPKELRAHIERQFYRGMSWDNYGDWHIDHITPKSTFDLSDPDEIRACWALTNLRPLWGADNIRKGARIEVLI